jgi:hypothetical protein
MARQLTVEYPGTIDRVLNRGEWRKPIFRDDDGRRCFLGPLAEARGKSGGPVRAREQRRTAERGEENKGIGRGWCLRPASFRKEVRGRTQGRREAEHYGEGAAGNRGSTGRGDRVGGTEAAPPDGGGLGTRAQGGCGQGGNGATAAAESVVTVKWIAARLHVGEPDNVNHWLYQWRKARRE